MTPGSRLRVAAALAVAVTGVAVVLWLLAGGRSGGSGPGGRPSAVEPSGGGQVPLPAPPEDVTGVRDDLATEGQSLMLFLAATDALPALELDPAAQRTECRALIADVLPRIGEPRELGGTASLILDPDTASLFQNDLAAKVALLARCAEGSARARDVREVAFTQRVLERRLDQLGVPR